MTYFIVKNQAVIKADGLRHFVVNAKTPDWRETHTAHQLMDIADEATEAEARTLGQKP